MSTVPGQKAQGDARPLKTKHRTTENLKQQKQILNKPKKSKILETEMTS